MNISISTCGTCGYEWRTGQDGSHTCATRMAETIADLRAKNADLRSRLEKAESYKKDAATATGKAFLSGVVYSAAQIIQAYDQPTIAETLLNTAVTKESDLSSCEEYDLSVIRNSLPEWHAKLGGG